MARTNVSLERGIGDKIIILRQQGKSYREIKEKLGISKGTVAYHLGEGQKLKSFERHKKQSEGIQRKVLSFLYPKRKKTAEVKPVTRTDIRKKMRGFLYVKKGKYAFRDTHLEVEPPVNRTWATLGTIWPGITVKNRHFQAVNQWTKQFDFENGKPIMFPFVRCRLSGEVIDAEL